MIGVVLHYFNYSLTLSRFFNKVEALQSPSNAKGIAAASSLRFLQGIAAASSLRFLQTLLHSGATACPMVYVVVSS